MRPGLWLAKFAADKQGKLTPDKSRLDCLKHNAGAWASASNCGEFFFGWDATNRNVREHVRRAIQTAVKEWGCNVLKIYFLYSSCRHGNGTYDLLSMSWAQTMDARGKGVERIVIDFGPLQHQERLKREESFNGWEQEGQSFDETTAGSTGNGRDC